MNATGRSDTPHGDSPAVAPDGAHHSISGSTRDQPADSGIEAVIFDFFGTLTEAASTEERHEGHRMVADALGVPVERYVTVLRETWKERAVGAYGDLPSTLRMIAERCGARPTAESVTRACSVRRAEQRNYLRLRPEAEPALATLAADVPVGLISDCTHELPERWPTLPIARYVTAALFSVEVGSKKPDPTIFRQAATRLGVVPGACLYVGDGDSRELPGAAAVGMHPVRLVAPDHTDAQVIEPIEWDGQTIGSLNDIPPLRERHSSRPG